MCFFSAGSSRRALQGCESSLEWAKHEIDFDGPAIGRGQGRSNEPDTSGEQMRPIASTEVGCFAALRSALNFMEFGAASARASNWRVVRAQCCRLGKFGRSPITNIDALTSTRRHCSVKSRRPRGSRWLATTSVSIFIASSRDLLQWHPLNASARSLLMIPLISVARKRWQATTMGHLSQSQYAGRRCTRVVHNQRPRDNWMLAGTARSRSIGTIACLGRAYSTRQMRAHKASN